MLTFAPSCQEGPGGGQSTEKEAGAKVPGLPELSVLEEWREGQCDWTGATGQGA